MHSEGYCYNIAFKIQDTHFYSPFYLLQFGGCDVVVGVNRLNTLGPIIWDFANLYMKFGIRGYIKELKALKHTTHSCKQTDKGLNDSLFKGRALLVQMVE